MCKNDLKVCIPPIIEKDTEILILGTFPSEISLQKQQYYGNEKNHFWTILGYCLGIDDFDLMNYEKRIKILKENKIGLWDAVYKCRRRTSSDSEIKDEIYNDLSNLKNKCPNLRKIVLSSKFMLQNNKRKEVLERAGVPYETAPSPSRRYIIPLKEKMRRWKEIIKKE